MRSGYARTVPRVIAACCRSKGIVMGTPMEAEEWALGRWPVLRHFRLLVEALSALRRRHAVIRQSVTLQLQPAYVPGHRSAHTLLRRVAAVERGAGRGGIPGVLEAAIRT
jgi:hypothetical protein